MITYVTHMRMTSLICVGRDSMQATGDGQGTEIEGLDFIREDFVCSDHRKWQDAAQTLVSLAALFTSINRASCQPWTLSHWSVFAVVFRV